MVVRTTEDQRTDDIHRQSEHGDDDRLAEMDRLRREDALDRTGHHHQRHAEQENGAGETGEYLDLPGSESEAMVAGVAPRRGVGQRREADGHGMRTHVPAVGKQGHRVVPPAGGNLDDHRCGGDQHHSGACPFRQRDCLRRRRACGSRGRGRRLRMSGPCRAVRGTW
jgi:hypothetical protein